MDFLDEIGVSGLHLLGGILDEELDDLLRARQILAGCLERGEGAVWVLMDSEMRSYPRYR